MRKKYSAEFKAKVALEAIPEDSYNLILMDLIDKAVLGNASYG